MTGPRRRPHDDRDLHYTAWNRGVQSRQDRAAVSEFPGGILRQWSFPILPFAGLLIVTFSYLRGWVLASRTRPQQLPSWRAFCFVGGIFSRWIAIASPMDALSDFLLTSPRVQHV